MALLKGTQVTLTSWLSNNNMLSLQHFAAVATILSSCLLLLTCNLLPAVYKAMSDSHVLKDIVSDGELLT